MKRYIIVVCISVCCFIYGPYVRLFALVNVTCSSNIYIYDTKNWNQAKWRERRKKTTHNITAKPTLPIFLRVYVCDSILHEPDVWFEHSQSVERTIHIDSATLMYAFRYKGFVQRHHQHTDITREKKKKTTTPNSRYNSRLLLLPYYWNNIEYRHYVQKQIQRNQNSW